MRVFLTQSFCGYTLGKSVSEVRPWLVWLVQLAALDASSLRFSENVHRTLWEPLGLSGTNSLPGAILALAVVGNVTDCAVRMPAAFKIDNNTKYRRISTIS